MESIEQNLSISPLTNPGQTSARTYWLTRFILLRMLGFLYAIAFMVAIYQVLPLIGSHGLLPVGNYLYEIRNAYGSDWAGCMRLPSVFWIGHSDHFLLGLAWIGFLLSCLVMAGFANGIIMTSLWVIYLSFVHVGQEWYGYGWELQLTETGFLAIFLCPVLDIRPFPKWAPPLPLIILFRFLSFRVMLGAGLIKIRGDEIWSNGTALYYHFETQPIPGPLSRWFHFLPPFILRLGVWFNFLAELVAPWFLFWPRISRHVAGLIIIIFQCVILLSGNLSFFNWLTILPTLACFDDEFWKKILPRKLVGSSARSASRLVGSKPRLGSAWVLCGVVGLLSIQPLLNLFSPGQAMNRSYDPLDLVNTYGAFGTVSKERLNVVFEGTMDEVPDDSAHWLPYVYKGLPVLTDQRPKQVAPYQWRLDWQMWFASMSTPSEYPWTYNLIWKLLHNDSGTLSLFASTPFNKAPPRYIRAVLYRYSFAKPGNPQRVWWNREKIDIWIPPTSLQDRGFCAFIQKQGWMD